MQNNPFNFATYQNAGTNSLELNNPNRAPVSTAGTKMYSREKPITTHFRSTSVKSDPTAKHGVINSCCIHQLDEERCPLGPIGPTSLSSIVR